MSCKTLLCNVNCRHILPICGIIQASAQEDIGREQFFKTQKANRSLKTIKMNVALIFVEVEWWAFNNYKQTFTLGIGEQWNMRIYRELTRPVIASPAIKGYSVHVACVQSNSFVVNLRPTHHIAISTIFPSLNVVVVINKGIQQMPTQLNKAT